MGEYALGRGWGQLQVDGMMGVNDEPNQRDIGLDYDVGDVGIPPPIINP